MTEQMGGGRGRYYALLLLVGLNTLLVWDKIIFTILLEPIKQEFGLSDAALGAVAGLVYALCMGAAGLPLGLLADRTNRRNLAAACLAFWSLMTAACGLAQSYGMLLLARVGVGVGEAGGGPTSLSIIADLFEHRRRATAMGIFSLGTPMAAILNLSIGAQVEHAYGWRATLFVASVPGFLLALLIFLTLKEPPRGRADNAVAPEKAPPLGETLRFILRQRSLVHLLAGGMLSYVVLAGVSSWSFSFLVRSHGVKLNEVGLALGLMIGGAGLLATACSGYVADTLARRDERWRAWIMSFGALGSVGFGASFLMAPSAWPAMILVACFAGASTFWLSTGFALCQSLVEIRMRGAVGAILFLLANMVGYGLGPSLAGFLSDGFAASAGTNSLRNALLTLITINLWSALHFALASRRLAPDIAHARAADQGQTVAVS